MTHSSSAVWQTGDIDQVWSKSIVWRCRAVCGWNVHASHSRVYICSSRVCSSSELEKAFGSQSSPWQTKTPREQVKTTIIG